MSNNPPFNYEEASKRNFGFLSKAEQEVLRKSRVAVAGVGGAGSAVVHALARLGIGAFHIADPDVYEMSNFNRQTGATMATIGRRKADFYCFRERFLLYRKARERGLWVLTAPPLGFGFTLIMFDPKGMSFEEYFGFSPNDSLEDLTGSLIAGITPRALFFEYLDRSGLSFGEGRLPSVSPAPMMLAGVIATEIVNLLTGKYPPLPAPTMFQFDAMLHRFHRRDYRWSIANKRTWRNRLRRLQSGA